MPLPHNQIDDVLKYYGASRIISFDAKRAFASIEFVALANMAHSHDLTDGGIVQGGFIAGWIDNVMARAAMFSTGSTKNMATADLNVSYFRSASSGVPYRAEGWIEHSGKTMLFLAGQILGPNEEIIAKATSTGRWLPLPKEK